MRCSEQASVRRDDVDLQFGCARGESGSGDHEQVNGHTTCSIWGEGQSESKQLDFEIGCGDLSSNNISLAGC
jgi:hypothetical protein